MLLPRSLRFRYMLRALLVLACYAATQQACVKSQHKMPAQSEQATYVEKQAPAPTIDDVQLSEPVVKDGLSLTISLDKMDYRLGEEVKLSFELKNETDHVMFIGDGFLAPDYHEVGPGRHFELLVVEEPGGEQEFGSAMLTEGNASGVRNIFRLAPGQSYSGDILLAGERAKGERGGVLRSKATKRGNHLLGSQAGKLRINLRYQVNPRSHAVLNPPPEFQSELLWEGALESTTLEFEIVDF